MKSNAEGDVKRLQYFIRCAMKIRGICIEYYDGISSFRIMSITSSKDRNKTQMG